MCVCTWADVSSSPVTSSQHALRAVACASLYLPLLRRGDTSAHLVKFTRLRQTFVWKALPTVMRTWFMRWLHRNEGLWGATRGQAFYLVL